MKLEELCELNQALKTIARILYKNTPSDRALRSGGGPERAAMRLQDFEGVVLAVRDHMLETVGPELGNFFIRSRSVAQP
ncbi:MAG: hypothetical protein GDA56_31540 [Hormoscilla sp. GM7CHS1pb]|nr:hypothetical protein [Hormoscilla sp. GM7CHS1pb]